MPTHPLNSALVGSRTVEPWVSIDDVAAHLGVRKESVYRWIEQRALPATKVGKLWKLKLSEVDGWMLHARLLAGASQAMPPSPQIGQATTGRTVDPKHVVLVIDDDEIVRDTLTDFLGDEGFGVLLAPDGAEALALLAPGRPLPRLIILDLKMPTLDGWQFLEQKILAPRLAPIPVIVVTAASSDGVVAAAVLSKPLRLAQLAAAIENILGVGDTVAAAALNRVGKEKGGDHAKRKR